MKCKAIAIIVASTALASILFSAPVAHAATCPGADSAPGEITPAGFNAATLCLLNVERSSRGLVTLRENPRLDSSALNHSNEMREYSFFGHDSPNGSPFEQRIDRTGYLDHVSSWRVGENLAWGTMNLGTPASITRAWMNSPEHRTNVLDPVFRRIGIGSVPGSPGNAGDMTGVIVTHDFGWVRRGPSKKANRSRTGRSA